MEIEIKYDMLVQIFNSLPRNHKFLEPLEDLLFFMFDYDIDCAYLKAEVNKND